MMTDEDRVELGKFLAQLRDYYQASAEAIDTFLNYLGRLFKEKKTEVYFSLKADRLPWEAREGAKGPYEWITKRSTNDSDLYRHLFNIIKVNTIDAGRFSHNIGSHYYWIGKERDAIFRRKKKGR